MHIISYNALRSVIEERRPGDEPEERLVDAGKGKEGVNGRM